MRFAKRVSGEKRKTPERAIAIGHDRVGGGACHGKALRHFVV